MNLNRRQFISTGAMAALAGCCQCPAAGRKPKFAVQTFSLRKLLAKDLAGTYESIGKLGLQGVELWDTPKFDAKTVRKLVDDNGLEVCGAHVGIDLLSPAKLNWTIDYAAAVGNRYIVVPWLGPGKDEKDVGGWWRRQADRFNELAAKLKPHGIKFGYHNHTHEFSTRFDGKTVWEIFVDNFTPDVMLQWDVGGLIHSGEDPAAWYRRYPRRCPSIHVRDEWDPQNGFFGVVGEPPKGMKGIDWKALKKAFDDDMPEWIVIEPVSSDRFDTVEKSLAYLKGLGL